MACGSTNQKRSTKLDIEDLAGIPAIRSVIDKHAETLKEAGVDRISIEPQDGATAIVPENGKPSASNAAMAKIGADLKAQGMMVKEDYASSRCLNEPVYLKVQAKGAGNGR